MCIEGDIFRHPIHTCYVWGHCKCNWYFSGTESEISAFFTEFFSSNSVVILNSILVFTLPKYSNLILIFRLLVWIFGSTYRKGEIFEAKPIENKSDMSLSTVNLFTVECSV